MLLLVFFTSVQSKGTQRVAYNKVPAWVKVQGLPSGVMLLLVFFVNNIQSKGAQSMACNTVQAWAKVLGLRSSAMLLLVFSARALVCESLLAIFPSVRELPLTYDQANVHAEIDSFHF